MSASSNLTNSAMAAGIAEIVTLPICTIKTNYQNTTGITIKKTIKTMYRQGGVLSFFRAMGAAVSSQVFSTSLKYTIYRYLEDKNLKYSNKILNGMASGITASIFTHPIDFIKIHLQMNKSMLKTLKDDGVSSIYRGYSKTFLKSALGNSLYFPIYEYCNNIFDNVLYSSICSSVFATIIIHPVDYFRIRHIYNLPWFQGWHPKYFFKGLSLNLLRVVPHFVITMSLIDYLNKIRNRN